MRVNWILARKRKSNQSISKQVAFLRSKLKDFNRYIYQTIGVEIINNEFGKYGIANSNEKTVITLFSNILDNDFKDELIRRLKIEKQIEIQEKENEDFYRVKGVRIHVNVYDELTNEYLGQTSLFSINEDMEIRFSYSFYTELSLNFQETIQKDIEKVLKEIEKQNKILI